MSLCLLDADLFKYAKNLDPANGEILGHVPEMSVAETKEAIDAASAAFKTWSQVTAKVRFPYVCSSKRRIESSKN